MHLMYKKAKDKGVRIDRGDLVAQGRRVELYPGRRRLVRRHCRLCEEPTRRATASTLRHYLVSSGLDRDHRGHLDLQPLPQRIRLRILVRALRPALPKRVITDTGKTQYLFRINKGVEDWAKASTSTCPRRASDPFLQHDLFRRRRHRRPLDGRDAQERRARRCRPSAGQVDAKCVELFKAGRVDFFAPADYRRGSDLFKRTCLLLDRILADIRVQEEMWRLGVGGSGSPSMRRTAPPLDAVGGALPVSSSSPERGEAASKGGGAKTKTRRRHGNSIGPSAIFTLGSWACANTRQTCRRRERSTRGFGSWSPTKHCAGRRLRKNM